MLLAGRSDHDPMRLATLLAVILAALAVQYVIDGIRAAVGE